MSDWTFSQWIIVPLLVLTDAIVLLGMVSMLGYGAYRLVFGGRVPVSEAKANTPNLPR